jgi:GH24 family phage-related lysozyme (muramidase)
MLTSKAGIDFIKKYEGCRLKAYKALPTERFYTIGYGHYGADVHKDTTITQVEADELLRKDLMKYESAVNRLGLTLSQNQFDVLVSFTYNCGQGNLHTLVRNRTLSQIADALLLYNKSSGRVVAGLTKRRQAERELFLKNYSSVSASNDYTTVAQEVIEGKWGNGTQRRDKLTRAGYDYKEVQKVVNKLLKG